MKKSKRALSFLLAVVMILTGLPSSSMTALADEAGTGTAAIHTYSEAEKDASGPDVTSPDIKKNPVVNVKADGYVSLVRIIPNPHWTPSGNPWDKYLGIDGPITSERKIELEDETPVYFRIDRRCSIGDLEIGTLSGEGENAVFTPLELLPGTSAETNQGMDAIYVVNPKFNEEITVTARIIPLTIPIKKWNDNIKLEDIIIENNKCFINESLPAAVVSDAKDSVTVWDGVNLTLKLTAEGVDANHRICGYYSYTGKDEAGNETNTTLSFPLEGSTSNFAFNVSGDVREIGYGISTMVTFEASENFRFFVKAWYGETYNEVNYVGTNSYNPGMIAIFKVSMPNDGKTYYVTTTGDETGMLTGELQPDGTVLYKFNPYKDTTVSVKEKLGPTSLTVESKSENVTYSVKTDENITKDTTAENKYIVARKAKTLEFTVAAKAPGIYPYARVFAKTVTPEGKVNLSEISAKPVKNTDAAGIISYTFTLNRADLDSDLKIEIFENYGDKEFAVTYDEGAVEKLSLFMGGKELFPSREEITDKKVTVVYFVSYGKTIDYTVTLGEHFNNGKIVCKEKGKSKTISMTRKSCSGKLVPSEESAMNITATPELWVKMFRIVNDGTPDRKEIPIEGEKSFGLMPGDKLENQYGLRVYLGAEDVFKLVDVRYSGKQVMNVYPDAINSIYLIKFRELKNKAPKPGDTGRLLIGVSRSLKIKKKLAVTLSIGSDVTGVNHEMPAGGCWADTVNSIRLRARGKESTACVGCELVPEPGIADGLVSVSMRTTKNTTLMVRIDKDAPEGKIATLKLFRNYLNPDNPRYYLTEAEGGLIDITVVKPDEYFKTLKLAKSVKGYDDVSLSVMVDEIPIGESISGRYYYKIEVTPKAPAGEEVPASIKEAVKEPFYFDQDFYEAFYDDEPEGDIGLEEAAPLCLSPEGSAYSDSSASLSLTRASEDEDEEEDEDEDDEDYDEDEDYDVPFDGHPATIRVNNAEYGSGGDYEFDVAVTLVKVKDANTALTAGNEASQVVLRSDPQVLTGRTLRASYASRITLSKKSAKIFTSQSNVPAAKLSYSSDGLMKRATAEDVTDCLPNEKLKAWISNDTLYVSASASTSVGKHTIHVLPMGASTVYKQPAVIDVTVRKSITSLKVTLSSSRIYKKKNNAAGITASVVYNEGDTAPALKKVKWYIATDESAFDEGETGYPDNMVTINSSGKITVKKRWDSENYPSYFYVVAYAADYDSGVNAVSTRVEITSEALILGKAMIVQYQPDTDNYEVVAKDGDSITSDKLYGSKFAVLRDGVSVARDEVLTKEELEEKTVPGTEYSVKSASKALKFTVSGNDRVPVCSKTAKDIKITAKASDGGGKSSSMKFSVKYKVPDKMDLRVSLGETILAYPDEDMDNVLFNGTVNSIITLRIMAQNDNSAWEPVNAYTNHSLSIKNGKILSSDKEKGIYRVVVTSDRATVTFKDNANSKTKTCVLVNEAYSKTKAAKIKRAPGTAKNILAGSTAGRNLVYTVPGGYEYCMVEMNAVSAEKKKDAYAAFAGACSKIGKCVSDGDVISLEFDATKIPAGKYNMTFTPGSLDPSGKFMAGTKPANIVVTVAKPKVRKGSYKPQTTYKIDAAPGARIDLTGKGSVIKEEAEYIGIYSCSVKGEGNKFLEYFELKDGNVLAIRDNLTDAQISALKAGKNDRVGYVTYAVSYGDNGYGEPYATVRKTVKITVNLKK